MPKGVEHRLKDAMADLDANGVESLMPKGVEHSTGSILKGI